MSIRALAGIAAVFFIACNGAPSTPGGTAPEVGPPPETQAPAAHPFSRAIEGAVTTAELPPDPPRTRPVPTDLIATDTRTFTAQVPFEGGKLSVVLEATPEVSDEQLSQLAKTLQPMAFDPRKRKDLAEFTKGSANLQKGMPEVRLPLVKGANNRLILLVPPDGWQLARPLIIRLRPEYAAPRPPADDGDVGAATAALTGSWDRVIGRLTCKPTGEPAVILPFVRLEIAGFPVDVDGTGAFSLTRPLTQVDRVTVTYQGRVRLPGTGGTVPSSMVLNVSAPVTVMDEWHDPRTENIDTPTGTTVGTVLDLGTLQATSIDCELFQLGARAMTTYLSQTRSPPPAGGLRIKRWWGVDVGTPYTYYDYVVIANNFLGGNRRDRRATIFHEFGHSIRHVADGDSGHWGWDNFRWAYARVHNGTEVFNEHYAFNEGWAQYWRCTDPVATGCPRTRAGQPSIDFLDWNELHIGARLGLMASAPGLNPAAMVQILTTNPGSIHRLIEFEEAYCQSVGLPNPYCNADRTPVRTKTSCPPGFNDDGATCRFINIVGKPFYGRGAGTIPNGCGTEENDAGLCYGTCQAGFDGVGPLCLRDCPGGYHDDGAFCRRDVWIFGSDHGSCPWWDVCGLALAGGCSSCPAGFHNDGCTCRRDAHIFGKESYARGVGTIPTDCPAGKGYDAGLCYVPCNAGFTGVGPVCWGSCDAGWADHGATCYQDPNVLVKY